MKKPQPTKEIAYRLEPKAHYITFWAVTEDAKNWLKTNASEFGTLRDGLNENTFSLYVFPNYENLQEVADYLQAMEDGSE